MPDDTFILRGIADIVVEWGPAGPGGQREFKSTGTDMLAGMVATEEAESAGTFDIDLCGVTEKPSGIIAKPVINKKADGATRNLDAASIDNESLRLSMCNSGDVVYAYYQAAGATKKRRSLLICGSEAGKLAPFAYSEDTLQSDTLATVVGILAEDVTTDGSYDQLVKVKLSLS